MRLALALDESKECDVNYTAGGFEFIIDKELEPQLGNIDIDFKVYGFTITSAQELPSKDCSGCSCGT